jgi:hypothetical protein
MRGRLPFPFADCYCRAKPGKKENSACESLVRLLRIAAPLRLCAFLLRCFAASEDRLRAKNLACGSRWRGRVDIVSGAADGGGWWIISSRTG